jgi:Dolichyl-phosphate-mannose-protein mannosyltransferase
VERAPAPDPDPAHPAHCHPVASLRSIPRWALALLLVLAVGGAWRAHHAVAHGRFLSTDERAYSVLGAAVSHGHYEPRGMNDPLHWPPGTPVLFAVARQLTGAPDEPLDPPAAYWAQWAVGMALIVAVFALARLLAGPWPAVAAATAVALYPPLNVITGDMVSEPLGALTIALVLVALAWAWRAPSPWRFAIAGALTGASILVRADLLVLPLVLAVVIALGLRRSGARPALLAAAAYVVAAAVVLAPWSYYASGRRAQFTPITSSSWSALYVGTYLPADGRIFALREKLGDEARRHNPRIRRIENRNLRTEWILDAVAARHPGLGRSEALKRETSRNLRRYALGRPLAFAAMQVRKLERMWIGYDRGTHHRRRDWILAVHLLVSAAGLAGLMYGIWRTRHPALVAILATVATATAVNAFFVSEARHNVRLVPLLAAGGAAGFALARLSRRGRAGRSEPPPGRASGSPRARAARPPDAAGVR